MLCPGPLSTLNVADFVGKLTKVHRGVELDFLVAILKERVEIKSFQDVPCIHLAEIHIEGGLENRLVFCTCVIHNIYVHQFQ